MTAPLVVLAAGGTGGHVFPASALALELERRGIGLAVVTDRRGGDLGGFLANVETHAIRAGGIAGKSFGGRLRGIVDLALGFLQARRILGRLRPSAVVGFGSYASVPTVLAASLAGIKTAIHEQNAILGRANRFLAGRVHAIATSFEASQGVPAEAAAKACHTGMPVRPQIVAVRARSYPALGPDGPVRLLVLGGSQGARRLSEVVPAAVGALGETLRRRLVVCQQCRAEDEGAVRQAYEGLGVAAELSPFFADVHERLAEAHLVIARAGASTVAEIATVGRPVILVPYPHAIDDHQSANAHAIDDAGAGWLLPEEALSAESLAARIDSLLGLPRMLERTAASARAVGRPDAAERLADLVAGLIGWNGAGLPGAGDKRRAA
jgi:UDP-N-acetylglucosamine--N-acetylmuramyl-(pentapeptide) pyrophosphoryl-undecaprenol N-acetylglucosamine transferase